MKLRSCLKTIATAVALVAGASSTALAANDNYLSLGTNQLVGQNTAKLSELNSAYDDVKPNIIQYYTQYNIDMGSTITDSLNLHVGYATLDVNKQTTNSELDLDGIGLYTGIHFGKPAILGIGYEYGIIEGTVTGDGGGTEAYDRLKGQYSSYYYQVGFEMGGDNTKLFVYFIQKLYAFNTTEKVDSLSATYAGGGLSILSKF